MKIEIVCSVCKKKKKFYPSQKKGKNKFCSFECYSKFEREHSKYLKFYNKEYLEKEYVENKRSMKDIAKEASVSAGLIWRWLHRLNIPTRTEEFTELKLEAKNGMWKGGFQIRHGYVFLLDKKHPNAMKDGYIAEHKKVMADKMGRPILKGETVHHKNGIKTDNRIENLQLFDSEKEHQTYESKIKDFAKRVMWTDEYPELKNELLSLFNKFLKE